MAQEIFKKDPADWSKQKSFFSHANDVITIDPPNRFEVKLHPHVYRLLKVADTAEWIASKTVGSAPTVLKPKSRSRLYIHCDCLEYHYINNNVSRILRTIVNTAAIKYQTEQAYCRKHKHVHNRWAA